MKILRYVGVIVCIFFVVGGICQGAQKIGFEVSDGFTVGGVWPAGWSASVNAGGTAQVSTGCPSSGAQCLELYMGSGGSSNVKYYPSLSVSANQKTLIQFDIYPSSYVSDDRNFNFCGYGGVYVYDQGYYFIGGLIFELQDYDGYDWAQPDDYKVKFLNSSQMEHVGYFVPGTYYRYSVVIDRAANKTSQKLEVIGGGAVAERTYNNSASSIPMIYFTGSQTSASTPSYVDQLVISQVSPADFVSPVGVDMVDFAVFTSAWQSVTGGLNWNGACDLIQDGVIDNKDLSVFCENWLYE